MENCNNLFLLSTIACKLSETLTDEEIALLSANLNTLADMLQSIQAQRTICSKVDKSSS